MAPRRRPLRLAVALALGLAAGCDDARPGGIAITDGGEAGSGFTFLDDDVPDAGPLARQSSYPHYDLTLVLPFQGEGRVVDMEVQPQATRLDVMFSVDTTGSFSGEIANLKLSLSQIIIPSLRQRAPDLAMGVARFADFAVTPFGHATDRPYQLLSPVTTNFTQVFYAVNGLDMPLGIGGDTPECWAESLYQIATGRGLTGSTGLGIDPYVPPAGTRPETLPGGAGFRGGSARVVVNITDAPTHEPSDYQSRVMGTHSLQEAGEQLRAVRARVIGIASGNPARPQLETVARATGSVVPAVAGRCATGVGGSTRPALGNECVLVFDLSPDGTGLGQTVVDAIVRFLDTLAFSRVVGHALDDVRGFIQRVEAVSADAPVGGEAPQRADQLPTAAPDGVPETFVDVLTRTRLRYRAVLRNTSVPELEWPQVFFVRVQLRGDEVIVGERVVRVIVPEGPKPDAGPDARALEAGGEDRPGSGGADAGAGDAGGQTERDAGFDAATDNGHEAGAPDLGAVATDRVAQGETGEGERDGAGADAADGGAGGDLDATGEDLGGPPERD